MLTSVAAAGARRSHGLACLPAGHCTPFSWQTPRDREGPLCPLPLGGEGQGEGARADRGSDGDGVAVAPGIGPALERARLGIAPDSLAAADDPGPVLDDVDLMAARAQDVSR